MAPLPSTSSEVYAISYRNQLKEILNMSIPPVTQKTDETKAEIKEIKEETKERMPKDDLVKHQY
jgi:hypothetical protein